MLKIMNGLPANVVGVSSEGKITAMDYEKILIPAVEEKFKTNKKLRLLYHLGDNFEGFELTAVFDDAVIGMKHLFSWEKVAIVSDHNLINTFVKFFGYIIPCEVRIFKEAEFEEAKKWISENN